MPHPVSRRLQSLALASIAALSFCPSAKADPTWGTNTGQIDLTFFRDTPCNADQILDAIQKVAPDQWAIIKKEPNGSRKIKWVRNWLIMIIGTAQSRPGILDYDNTNNIFGDWFWLQVEPYQDQIAAVCAGPDLRDRDKYGPKGKKAPQYNPGYDTAGSSPAPPASPAPSAPPTPEHH